MTFKQFLDSFIPQLQQKNKQFNQAFWLLETTGSQDAASLEASLKIEYRTLLSDKKIFDQLLVWDKDLTLTDPLLKRQLNLLIRAFKPNQIPKELLVKIAEEETKLTLLYSNFRAEVDGKCYTENEIKEVLKKENNVKKRKSVWGASKQLGTLLGSPILKLVELRNQAAQSLGYDNYFSMELKLQEVDEEWLFKLFDTLADQSEEAYAKVLKEINESLAERFKVDVKEVGPWAWAESFCQDDPLFAAELDCLVENMDLIETSRNFYKGMHLDVSGVLERSDNFERQGKHQHAFCINIDREGDVRTLNNVQPTIKWLETVLHELGHAVYEEGFADDLPWLLRQPPHMITTEAMALLAGRQAYRAKSLETLCVNSPSELRKTGENSLRRHQLIFSRWVMVMSYFERELYRNPQQDLNQLWWHLVKKFQKIEVSDREGYDDWAAKLHIGLAPVYYFSYLLGELFASTLEKKIKVFSSKSTGDFLKQKLFSSGDRFNWHELIKQITGEQLTSEAWLSQFADKSIDH